MSKIEHFYGDATFGENWFTFPNLYSEMVNIFPSGSHFIELGSWKGRSAAYMGVEINNSGKDIKFDCIDAWDDSLNPPETRNHGGDLMDIFLTNTRPVSHIITAKKMDSANAAKDYEDNSLEFVFIDADHSYEGVKRDFIAWAPKVKPGCVLAGHDYGWAPEIRRAVDDCIGEGDYSDPWGNGCFILRKTESGGFVKY